MVTLNHLQIRSSKYGQATITNGTPAAQEIPVKMMTARQYHLSLLAGGVNVWKNSRKLSLTMLRDVQLRTNVTSLNL
jgi:hypothetical protein